MKEARKLISERDFNRALFDAYCLGRRHKASGTNWPVDFSALANEAGRFSAADEIAYELDITSARERAFRADWRAQKAEVVVAL